VKAAEWKNPQCEVLKPYGRLVRQMVWFGEPEIGNFNVTPGTHLWCLILGGLLIGKIVGEIFLSFGVAYQVFPRAQILPVFSAVQNSVW
jgi:hypothetical protein